MPKGQGDCGAGWSESVYRLLLFLYPSDFRLEYGPGMVDAFRDRWMIEHTQKPRWVAVRVWMFAIRDLISSAVEERRSQWRSRTSRNQLPTNPGRRPKIELFHDIWRDIRHAFRGFRRNPGFVALAVATAAIGIGSNAAIFSVVNSVVLRPLPYEKPDQLVFLRETWNDFGWGPASYPNLIDWREQNDVFEFLAAFEWTSTSLQGAGPPVRLETISAEANLFELLGSSPLIGRTFAVGEDHVGAQPVVVLSHFFWERMFASDPAVVGTALNLNGEPHEVVGVMPDGFYFPADAENVDLWLPLRLTTNRVFDRGSHSLAVVGRLAPNISIEAADLQMDEIAGRISELYPEIQGGGGVWVRPLHEEIVGNVRPLLLILFGAVGLVLLIACANLGNMMLARATDRNREVALRLALGAGRRRLIRMFLTESLLLSLLGGTLGVLIAYLSIDALVAFGGAQIPRSASIHLDGRVFAFLLAVASLTGVVFGLAPAVFASSDNLLSGLGGTSGRGGSSRRRRMFRNALVVTEFALAFVLLLSAGLLTRTLMSLEDVEPGFSGENVITMRLSLAADKYPGNSVTRFYSDVLDRVDAIPGVTKLGMNCRLPLQGWGHSGRFQLDGVPWGAPGTEPHAHWRYVSAGYFDAIEMRIVRGRGFSADDDAEGLPVLIINEALARRYYPNEDPVGKIIRMPTAPELFLNPEERRMTIVGIVGDVLEAGLHRPPRPILYFPFKQIEQFELLADMSLVVQTQLPTASLVPSIRSAVQALDPGQPIYDVMTMDQVVSESLSGRRFTSWLFGGFAVVALVLSLAGIYGVVSYLVAQRTNEFGVRIALGASPKAVVSEVLSGGAVLVGIGLALGIVAAVAMSRLISGMLFGVTPTDVPTYALASMMLAAVALAACLVPARRAMRVDPVEALRHE